jgi:hypothetical protein
MRAPRCFVQVFLCRRCDPGQSPLLRVWAAPRPSGLTRRAPIGRHGVLIRTTRIALPTAARIAPSSTKRQRSPTTPSQHWYAEARRATDRAEPHQTGPRNPLTTVFALIYWCRRGDLNSGEGLRRVSSNHV